MRKRWKPNTLSATPTAPTAQTSTRSGTPHRLGYWLYAVIVLAAALGLPLLWTSLTSLQFSLVLLAGVLYIAGVPVLMRGRPNPWPDTFGYHEVWHAFTVAAGACQVCAIALVVS